MVQNAEARFLLFILLLLYCYSIIIHFVLICVCVCVYSCLSYPACQSHLFCVPFHYHLWVWPVRLYSIYPLYLINGRISGEKLLNIKSVFRFSLQGLSATLLKLKRIQRDLIIHLYRSSQEVTVFLV
jgi:hypothetical protein